MATRDFPPFPIRKADEYSRHLARGLALAYLMHEGRGDIIRNYGNWGEQANLTRSGATWSRRDSGLYGLHFTNNTDVASNTIFSHEIPEEWSYAVWVKSDVLQANTGSADILSLFDGGLPQLRAFSDVVGVWSWQKRSIADTYTVLPPADFPDDGTRLIVSVFNGIGIPPVQLRTGKNLDGLPRKPNSYAVFNSGQGVQSTSFSSTFLGNNEGRTTPWKGTIGPFYFWDRVISLEEVQALKYDPYAPFRRDTALNQVPATMVPFMTANPHPSDDNGSGVSLSSDDDLFIFIKDDYQYLNLPDVEVIEDHAAPMLGITINEPHTYIDIPDDELTFINVIGNPLIEITDTYIYRDIPADQQVSANLLGRPVIEVADTYQYRERPTTAVGGGTQVPMGITVGEDYPYRGDPEDNIVTINGEAI